MLARQHRESYQSRTLSSDLPAGQLGASAGREPLPYRPRPQALYISATALALAPAAAAESLIYRKRIRETKIEKDPIFILGHWRSGTTYLQNVLSRDEQFGWFDPVNTIGLPYSLLLRRSKRASGTAARRITCSTRSISRWRRRSAC